MSQRIVLAPDSFKGSLSAAEFCRIADAEIRRAHPDWTCASMPLADGGEGTAAALLAARKGEWVPCRVTGPLPDRRIDAGFAWWPAQGEALVELASAAGLTLLRREELDPLRTTTHGVGELVRAAAASGARRILLAVGGSATVDGGTGAASVLGWRFEDAAGRPLPPGGGALEGLARIVAPARGPALPLIEVLCDVDNPLCGPDGAAEVYAPQKGADAAAVLRLARGLRRLEAAVRARGGPALADLPGAGAAGGMAAGALAFLRARLVDGIGTVMDFCGLPAALEGTAWVLTGEGCLDAQSLRGKVVSGVIRAARRAGVRVAVLAGRVRLAPAEWREAGIDDARAIAPDGMPLSEAVARAPVLLAEALRQWIGGRECGRS